jgi:hypothetical protein
MNGWIYTRKWKDEGLEIHKIGKYRDTQATRQINRQTESRKRTFDISSTKLDKSHLQLQFIQENCPTALNKH